MELALASRPISFSPFVLSSYGILSSLSREQPHNKGGPSAHDVHQAPRIEEPNGEEWGGWTAWTPWSLTTSYYPLKEPGDSARLQISQRAYWVGQKRPSSPTPRVDPSCPYLHRTNRNISNRFTTNKLQKTNKWRKIISYLESAVSLMDEILCSNPHIDHSKDQKQGCAPSPRPCSNLEAPSPTGGRGYERKDWTSLFGSSWMYRKREPQTKRGLGDRACLGYCTRSAPK